MMSEPQQEHHWLQKMVGDWTYEATCDMGPDQPKTQTTGSERVRSLGGLWVIAEGEGTMPGGGPARMIMTLGFDPTSKRYRGTWVGSMMTHMWIYDGVVDASGKVLPLDTVGPSFSGDGKLAKYQDIIEFKSDDHRTLTSRTQAEDGTWREFMTAHYRRKR